MKRLSREAREAAMQRIRSTRHSMNDFPDAYKHLSHVTGFLGKDVKFHAPAECRDTALDYSRRRNLVLGPVEDVDGDQINDVVLYNWDGTPAIVNGYELTSSERPYRIKFRQMYPSKVQQTEVGGYAGFKKNFHSIDGMTSWMETDIPPKFARIKPPKPKRVIAPSLYDYYSDQVRQPLFVAINTLLDGRNHLKSTFSIFNIIALGYINFVLGRLWNLPENSEVVEAIKVKVPDTGDLLCGNHRMELFKQYIKKNQDKIRSQVMPYIQEIIAQTVDMKPGTPIHTLLEPVLSMVAGMPTDLSLAEAKLAKDYDTLHHINVQKAQIADTMKKHFAYCKSRLINNVFRGFDEGDIPDTKLGPTYADRVRRYLDTLLTLDPLSRSKAILALLRDRKHTTDLIKYMDIIKEDQYLPLYEEINRRLNFAGWLE